MNVSMNEVSLLTVLKENGGFSVNMKHMIVQKSDGYAVSLTNNQVYLEGDDYTDNIAIKRAIREIWNFLRLLDITDKKKLIIGGWINPEGVAYIDASIYETDKETAVRIAKLFNQKAIYDFKNNESIFVGL